MGERSDYVLVTLTLFSRSPHYKFSKKILVNEVKSLCTQYLFNQWLETELAQIHHKNRAPHYEFSKKILVNEVKSLCAHYLFNQWLEFDQTGTDTSSGWGKEVIRFWWPWPYFQGHCIINTQKVSLVNAVKSLCAHYLFNQLLVLLDFGDLVFIFKVTPALWNLNFLRKRFYALCRGYQISTAYWQFSFFFFFFKVCPLK